jgi:hypothetical protein
VKEKKGNVTEYLFFNQRDGFIIDVVENNTNKSIEASRDFSKLLETSFGLLTGVTGNPRVVYTLEGNQSRATIIKIKDLYEELNIKELK